ncbi:MAG: amidohydrolase [Verrucomicrobiales bacterium]|nr:amidohydrolase [Verrucomicrobiales bacterium]
MKSITRRKFLGTAAASTVGSAILSADEAGPNWIDAHVHVWPGDRDEYPVSENFKDRKIKPPAFPPSELFAHQKGTGVHRTVLVQMSFYEFDNSYMLDVMEKYPGRFGGIGIVDRSKSDVAEEMKSLGEKKVRGFRLYASSERVKGWDADAGMETMWKTGAEEGLAICCLTDPGALPTVHKWCEKHRDTPVVIDHFARNGVKGEIRQEELDRLLALADFPNTHLKVSAFYALGKKAPPYTDLGDMVRQVRDAFGSERCMWGSDCPYQVQGEHTYAASLSMITEKLGFLSAEDQENILKNTADKLFFA